MAAHRPKDAQPARRPAGSSWNAFVLGDGRILPILETVGRRQIREIDPLSAEGRRLLAQGCVHLRWADGRQAGAVPVDRVLEEIDARTRARRALYPGDAPRWTDHHDDLLRRIGSARRRLRTDS